MEYKYTPKYIKELLDYKSGEVVTAGDYNRFLNLLNVAVDNNTDALQQLINNSLAGGSAEQLLARKGTGSLDFHWVDPMPGPQGERGEPGVPGQDGRDGRDGLDGADGTNGIDGAPGADGVGVPVGGTTGQVLKKRTNADHDTEWGEAASVLVKATGAEVITGTDDEKYVTPKAIKDGMLVSGDTLPIGSMIPFGSLTIPDNWLLCDGRAISRADYSELFAVIGTSYGAGDGTTTFNLPNKKGRTSVGHDTSQTEFNTIGKTGGSKDLQEHDHKEYFVTNDGNRTPAVTSYSGTEIGTFVKLEDSYESDRAGLVTGFAGTGDSGNLQPYETDVWIIKAKQSAGVVATVVDDLTSTSPTDALSANMGRVLGGHKSVRITAPTSSCLGGWVNDVDRSFPCNTLSLNDSNYFTPELVSLSGRSVYKIKILKTGKYLVMLNTGKENNTTGSVTYVLGGNGSQLNNIIWDARIMVSTTGYSEFKSASSVISLNAGDVIYPIAYGDTSLQCGFDVTLIYLGN